MVLGPGRGCDGCSELFLSLRICPGPGTQAYSGSVYTTKHQPGGRQWGKKETHVSGLFLIFSKWENKVQSLVWYSYSGLVKDLYFLYISILMIGLSILPT